MAGAPFVPIVTGRVAACASAKQKRRRAVAWVAVVGATIGIGCHRETEMVPLIDQKIAIQDRFYDVLALSPERALIVGYGGKILETEDGGANWARIPSGTGDHALYNIAFADSTHGWIVGQDGLILHSADAGKTWRPQDSGTARYLFNVTALDRNHAWAVGDRSTLTTTTDGGKTWRARKVKTGDDVAGGISMAAQDPVYYDVRFADQNTGWISGEFGKLLHTTDGGETWMEQQQGLMGDEFFDVLDLPTMFGMSFKSPLEGIAVGIDARVARTQDAGASWAWEKVESPYPLQDPFFAAHIFQDGSGWAIGAAGQVVRRRVGETVWQLADLGQPVFTWLRGISFFDAQNGWLVGGYGLILRTTDGGKTWVPCFG
jgi:photosystem II stability/assembly factor-like uncharacterized protein